MKQSDKVASFVSKRFIHSFIGFHIERTDQHIEKKDLSSIKAATSLLVIESACSLRI
jgi:hypothetical protein